MPDHIWIGEVHQQEVVSPCVESRASVSSVSSKALIAGFKS